MLVTKIEVQKKDDTRANLYMDDKFYSGISLELVIKEHLKVGLEIEKEKLDELILEDEKEKAISKAVKYLSSNLKTTKQIRDYLRKKDYNDSMIDYVIEKMIEYKYLDDTAYAKAYILTYSNKYGKLKLRQELKLKGVSEKIIDEELDNENIPNNIESVANKYLKNKEVSPDTLNKLSRFLYARGYSFDEINSFIHNLKEE